jgi:hypothetical protein
MIRNSPAYSRKNHTKYYNEHQTDIFATSKFYWCNIEKYMKNCRNIHHHHRAHPLALAHVPSYGFALPSSRHLRYALMRHVRRPNNLPFLPPDAPSPWIPNPPASHPPLSWGLGLGFGSYLRSLCG